MSEPSAQPLPPSGAQAPPVSMTQTMLDTAAGALQSHAPIRQHGAYLCAFHSYAAQPSRPKILAHHYCSHVNQEMHQCVIYDSNDKNAKLIGVEYLISERLFNTLPLEERVYWHSHHFEVASGMLVLPGVPEMAERTVVQEIANMYGKTIHTWQSECDPLPIGAPQLMLSLLSKEEATAEEWKHKDEVTGISSAERAEMRKQLEYHSKIEGADSGRGLTLTHNIQQGKEGGQAKEERGGAAHKMGVDAEMKETSRSLPLHTVPGTQEALNAAAGGVAQPAAKTDQPREV